MSRHTPVTRWAALSVLLLLVACNPLARDRDVDTIMRRVFDEVRLHQYDVLASDLSHSMQDAGGIEEIREQTARFPPDAPTRRRVVSTQNFVLNSVTGVLATDEYDYGGGRALFVLRVIKPSGSEGWQVDGLQWRSATAPQLEANDFSLDNLTIKEYIFLVFALTSPILMVAALVKVIRTREIKRKWVWAIVAFAGIGAFRMNLATDALAYQLLSIQLIGAGIVRASSRFAPWFASTTLPIGAVIILTGLWGRVNGSRDRAAGKPRVVQ